MSTTAVVLAAGGARRFGAPKQLALLDGRPLLQHVVDVAASVPALREVVVVLGARADAVRAGVRLGATTVRECADWEEGMAAALRTGLAAAPDGDVLVLLGDQPGVTPAVIDRLLAQVADRRVAGTVVDAARASYDGAPGHPVLLGPRLVARVPQLTGDTGARALLAGVDVLLVEVGGLGDGRDIDTPSDLAAWRP